MTEHLPECPILKPCCDDEEFPEHGFCGNYAGRCLHCMAECICDELRSCEERVLKDTATRHLALIKMIGLGILQTRADELRACEERIAGQLKEQRSEDSKWSYAKGFDDARWLAAKEALQAVQHEEPCDCEPCKAITRALAELWTRGGDQP